MTELKAIRRKVAAAIAPGEVVFLDTSGDSENVGVHYQGMFAVGGSVAGALEGIAMTLRAIGAAPPENQGIRFQGGENTDGGDADDGGSDD